MTQETAQETKEKAKIERNNRAEDKLLIRALHDMGSNGPRLMH
jgi:hypothetical protein